MAVINRNILFVCFYLIFFTSCIVTKPKKKCFLIRESNTIYGHEMGQKEFYVPKMYIPALIEDLYSTDKNSEIKHRDFSRNTPEKYCGYHIYGCRDTTWAKQAMASHLIEKYNIERSDSIYQDTVHRLTIVDEGKLVKSQDSCIMQIIMGDVIDGVIYTHYKCTPWGPIVQQTLPYYLDKNTNSVEYEKREGNYDISVPKYITRGKGLAHYSKTYLEPYGLSLEFERVDTIHLSVYRYREKKSYK